ncbi:ABC transporter ATP-binding protein, partial [Streptococcus suis]
AQSGQTVLFSSLVLSVAEQLCDRIAILRKGQLIFVGSIDELKSQYPDKDLETIYLELAGLQQVKAGEEV